MYAPGHLEDARQRAHCLLQERDRAALQGETDEAREAGQWVLVDGEETVLIEEAWSALEPGRV